MPRSKAKAPLRLGFLGEMAVSRGEEQLALPPSRKTRALLAYLALTERPHRRERLCELFWDVADDPRGALRWSLTKLRPLVDEPNRERLRADRDSIALDLSDALVDALGVRRDLAAGVEKLSTQRLLELAREFRGDLLEGLDLTEFHDFHAWCVAERESARKLHATILSTLVSRLDDSPEDALPHARRLAQVAPLDEAARAILVRLLVTCGRRDEAKEHHDAGLRLLAEHGIAPRGELSSTWRRLQRPETSPPEPVATRLKSSGDGPTSADSGRTLEAARREPLPPGVPRARVPRNAAAARPPATRYAKSGDVNIAYQVVGEGPPLVYIPGWVSHVEYGWENSAYAPFLHRLRSFCRMILLDRRGTGLSDPVVTLPTLEERMEDVRAVMDAAGIERATLFGISESGPLAMLFASTYPERTTGLILYGTFARGSWHPDYPWRWRPEQVEATLEYLSREWGTGKVATALAPSIARDPRLVEAWGRFERLSVSPSQAQTLFRIALAGDVRHVLPAIHTPTLVIQRSDDQIATTPGMRYIAEHISGARYVELPGSDHFPWVGDFDPILDEVEEFVTGVRPEPRIDRVLATVLFVDIVDSTKRLARIGDKAWRDLLSRFREVVRTELARARGKEIDTTGDSLLATFDGPARAVRCACAISDAVRGLDLEIRAGLHTGECELLEGNLAGIAVHIGARVAEAADPSEVLVSSTVKDLVAGSGISFQSRGTHELQGVPGEWVLYRVERPTAVSP